MPVISALGRLKQEPWEFKASLSYTARHSKETKQKKTKFKNSNFITCYYSVLHILMQFKH
jgi:hypothetical protein